MFFESNQDEIKNVQTLTREQNVKTIGYHTTIIFVKAQIQNIKVDELLNGKKTPFSQELCNHLPRSPYAVSTVALYSAFTPVTICSIYRYLGDGYTFVHGG